MKYFVISLVGAMFSRNFCQKGVRESKFLKFHIAMCTQQFFSSNQFRVKFFSKKLFSQNFCEVAVKFRNFHTVNCKMWFGKAKK